MVKKKVSKEIRSKANVAKKKMNDGIKATKEEMEKIGKKAARFIDKNPRKAAAIAAGVGVATGAAAIASTRKKKKKFFG